MNVRKHEENPLSILCSTIDFILGLELEIHPTQMTNSSPSSLKLFLTSLKAVIHY